MPSEDVRPVLGAERVDEPLDVGELEHLEQVVGSVRRRDEASTRPEYPSELTQRQLEIEDVVKHPGGDRDVE